MKKKQIQKAKQAKKAPVSAKAQLRNLTLAMEVESKVKCMYSALQSLHHDLSQYDDPLATVIARDPELENGAVKDTLLYIDRKLCYVQTELETLLSNIRALEKSYKACTGLSEL